jgi:hypothetical protein
MKGMSKGNTRAYCSLQCKKELARKRKEAKTAEDFVKGKHELKGRPIPYAELERRAEIERAFGKGSELRMWLKRDLI